MQLRTCSDGALSVWFRSRKVHLTANSEPPGAEMSNLKLVYDLANLDRAWRWILSNPDAAYKGYYRALYANFGVASADLLKDLSER